MYSDMETHPPAQRRLFHSTIDLVNEASNLVQSDQSDSEDSIHRVRVILKILRSRHQLIRPLVHPTSYRSANRRIKSAADALAGRRDHDVLLKTHGKLLKKTSGKKTTKSMKLLVPLLEQVKDVALEPIDWANVRKRLDAEAAFWKRQNGRGKGISDESILEGLRITYRKARKRFQKAYKDQDRHLFHDWRKWTKYLLYQLQALDALGCEKLQKRIRALTRLGKLLGNHHDLHIYRQHIHQIPASDFSSDQLARCDIRIRQSEKALETQCKKIAQVQFKEKPLAFEHAIRKNWMKKRKKTEVAPASIK